MAVQHYLSGDYSKIIQDIEGSHDNTMDEIADLTGDPD